MFKVIKGSDTSTLIITYFDYNLGTGGTGLDCAMLVTSKDWEWVLDDHSSWSSHSSDPYGRAKIVDLMDAWREQSNPV